MHDVDCVAGVLTYRRGKSNPSIDRSGAVFVTTSALTVRNTRKWYESEGGRGFAPIVHQRALSNYAWLKKPASANRLKVHELVALCTAALRPSRKAWAQFVSHLKKLESENELTSDEVTAIVASDLTEHVLVEVDPNEESDANSLSEVVERVKATYKEGADERERLAYEAAAANRQDADSLLQRAVLNSRRIATALSWLIAGVLVASLVIGSVLTVVAAAGKGPTSPWVIGLAVVPLSVIALFGIVWGFTVTAWRSRLEDSIYAPVLRWMTGGR